MKNNLLTKGPIFKALFIFSLPIIVTNTINILFHAADVAVLAFFSGDADVAAVEFAINHYGPVYLRFGRMAVPVVNDNAEYKFEMGKGVNLVDGKDVTIVANGVMLRLKPLSR